MKKTILNLLVISFVFVAIFSSCQSTNDKVEKAEDKLQSANENVLEAEQNLYETRQDSITEYEKFKIESQEKIAVLEKDIAKLKVEISNKRMGNRAKLERELSVLEQKNKEMKIKLENYKEDEKNKWEKFKAEFGRDMDELGNAFKNLTIKNN